MDSNALYAEAAYPWLILKLADRNQAYGIDGLTPQIAGLMELWAKHLDEQARLQDAVIEKSRVDYGLAEFDLLRLQVEQAETVDEKRELYRRAVEIMNEVNRSVEGLELIADSYDDNETQASDRQDDDITRNPDHQTGF